MAAVSVTTGPIQSRTISPVALLATMALVFASVVVVIGVAHYTHSITGIWIANAILLTIIMKHRRRDWLFIAIAGSIANLAAGMLASGSIPMALFFTSLNLLEVFCVAVPLRFFKQDRDFSRSGTLLAFYALAAGPAPIMGALLSASLAHVMRDAPFITTALNWYSADALGLVIVVPPLMTVRLAAIKAMFSREQILWTSALIGTMLAAIALNFFARSYPVAFLFFPVVLLMTFQRGFAGGTIGLLLAAIYLLAPAFVGNSSGPLHAHSVHQQIVVVQIFIAVMGFSVVLVGAALEERRRLELGLAAAIARAENSREEAIVAKESAEKANRTKSMFLATMSHELRTPLNAVIGFAEMMHAEFFGPLGDKRYHEYTGVIQSAGRHLLDLINDILDMSKIEAGKHEILREELNLNEIIGDGLALMLENAASGGVSLMSDLPQTPLMIDADRRAMKQILLNLLSNAVKFTPYGGRVTASAQTLDGRVVLSVRDNGVGIPADQIYRLGNPFVQIRNNAGTSQTGTGLGLALVRSLSEMQGGSMKIESEEGRGTMVSVSFPALEKASLAA